jgi:hypothetical protein
MVEAEDAAGETPPRRRTWLPMAVWTAAIVAALALVWGGASLYATLREVRTALVEVHARIVSSIDDGSSEKRISRLGGPQRAVRKVALYRRLSWLPTVRAQVFVKDRGAEHNAIANLLQECGPAGMRVLIEDLGDKNANVRCWTALALANTEQESREAAVKALIGTVEDPDRDVRWAAMQALVMLGPQNKAALPALEKLRDKPGGPSGPWLEEAIKMIRGEEKK